MDHFGNTNELFTGKAGLLLSKLQGVFIHHSLVFIIEINVILNKAVIMPPLINHVFGDRRQPDEVGALLRTYEEVGALRHLMLPQIRYDKLLSVQLMGTFDPGCQYRVSFSGSTADKDNESRNSDILDRACVSANSYGRHKTVRCR
ncbi:hypothetical protein D3C81_1630350 [compost metagenome]